MPEPKPIPRVLVGAETKFKFAQELDPGRRNSDFEVTGPCIFHFCILDEFCFRCSSFFPLSSRQLFLLQFCYFFYVGQTFLLFVISINHLIVIFNSISVRFLISVIYSIFLIVISFPIFLFDISSILINIAYTASFLNVIFSVSSATHFAPPPFHLFLFSYSVINPIDFLEKMFTTPSSRQRNMLSGATFCLLFIWKNFNDRNYQNSSKSVTFSDFMHFLTENLGKTPTRFWSVTLLCNSLLIELQNRHQNPV